MEVWPKEICIHHQKAREEGSYSDLGTSTDWASDTAHTWVPISLSDNFPKSACCCHSFNQSLYAILRSVLQCSAVAWCSVIVWCGVVCGVV